MWAAKWLPSRSDLRASSYSRLESIVRMHLVPEFGSRPLATISNTEIRKWALRMTKDGMSAAVVRKCVFTLRSMLDAAVADQRLAVNPAGNVPLPTEHAAEQRYLDGEQVLTLADLITPRYRALVLLGAFGGLRWGEMAGLRRGRVDVLRSRVTVCETAVDIGGKIAFREPKTKNSRRTIPLARSIMAELEQHLTEYVGMARTRSSSPAHRQPCLPGHVLASCVEAGDQKGRAGRTTHPRPEAHLRVAHGRGRGEPERGVGLGGPFDGRVHVGPVWPPVRRARRRCG